MKKIVILGSEGFVGSELYNYLDDDLVIGLNKNQCDITNRSYIENMILDCEPDYIINCTGITSKQFKDKEKSFNVNFMGVKNLLDIAHELDYKGKIILIGSSEISNPKSVYGINKKIAWEYSNMIMHNTSLQLVTLFPSIIYGEKQKGNMFIPSMVRAYKEGKPFDMSSGHQQRNFVHMDDIVSAIEILINTDKDYNDFGNYLPLHYPTNFTLRQVVQVFNKITNGKIHLNYGKIPLLNGEDLMFDNQGYISYTKLGWNPRITLELGLKRCIQ